MYYYVSIENNPNYYNGHNLILITIFTNNLSLSNKFSTSKLIWYKSLSSRTDSDILQISNSYTI